MSVYTFIASEKPLENVVNEKIKFSEDGKSLYVENEEDFDELEINNKQSYDVGTHTKKPYIADLNLKFTAERAHQLIEYISNHLKNANELEIWSIWLDDEEKTPSIISCKINDLTETQIKDILHSDPFVPNCLIVEK